MACEIVLLHGVGRDFRIMSPMAAYLEQEFNCIVHNISYPSMDHDFDELVVFVRDILEQRITKDVQLHFVGHSMGGILIRLLLQTWRPTLLGRVVQVGSPNHGTELVDFLNQTHIFKIVYGVAASRLGTDKGSIIHELEPIDYDIGVIAANQVSLTDWFFDVCVFNRENDGLVPLDSTKIANMKDFTVIPTNHVDIIYDSRTFDHVARFLKFGSFIA